MHLDSTLIDATFAEAFRMRYARLIVTAHDEFWLRAATAEFHGLRQLDHRLRRRGGSRMLASPDETPDRRPGAALLAFGFSAEALGRAVLNRTGQCLMTCPTTAVFDGLAARRRARAARQIASLFRRRLSKKQACRRRAVLANPGDGWRISGGRIARASRRASAAGTSFLQSADLNAALAAARRGVEAVAAMRGAITPFPGGVARSGSKVGSRYKKLKASTGDAVLPDASRPRRIAAPSAGESSRYEIVIDGVDEPSSRRRDGRGDAGRRRSRSC